MEVERELAAMTAERDNLRKAGEMTTKINDGGPALKARNAWDDEQTKQRYIQWPGAWADAMLAERDKP